MACNIALDAVNIVALEENGRKEIDIKRYARIEKVTAVIITITVLKRGLVVCWIMFVNFVFRSLAELSKNLPFWKVLW